MVPGKVAIVPLGDASLLVRFADSLSDAANRRAVAFAQRLSADPPEGVEEVVPSLVSVQLRLKPGTSLRRLAGEISLRVDDTETPLVGDMREIAVTYDGEDLPEVGSLTGRGADGFVRAHSESRLRVLAVGFAPGFVYCGFHDPGLVVPRRQHVRASVPAGTILFAAGQTAITSTPIRTGWHVIGRTPFRNFNALTMPPTTLRPGDDVRFRRA